MYFIIAVFCKYCHNIHKRARVDVRKILSYFIVFIIFRFGAKDEQYYEYSWGKSIVLAMSALTQRGTESGTPWDFSARISFFM